MFTKKEQPCQNNPKTSYTEKQAIHEPSGWLMFTSSSFDEKKKLIIIEYKEMIPLTKEEKRSYKKQEACHTCEKRYCVDKDDEDYTNRKRLKTTVITQEKLEELLISNATSIINFQKIFQ